MCVKSVSFGPTADGSKPRWEKCEQQRVSCFLFVKIIKQTLVQQTHAFAQGVIRLEPVADGKLEKRQSCNAWFMVTTRNKWTRVLKLELVSETMSQPADKDLACSTGPTAKSTGSVLGSINGNILSQTQNLCPWRGWRGRVCLFISSITLVHPSMFSLRGRVSNVRYCRS